MSTGCDRSLWAGKSDSIPRHSRWQDRKACHQSYVNYFFLFTFYILYFFVGKSFGPATGRQVSIDVQSVLDASQQTTSGCGPHLWAQKDVAPARVQSPPLSFTYSVILLANHLMFTIFSLLCIFFFFGILPFSHFILFIQICKIYVLASNFHYKMSYDSSMAKLEIV